MTERGKFRNDVRRALESGVRPIEFRFFPVADFDGNEYKAYRAETVIHSTVKGEMPEKYYARVSDQGKIGLGLFGNSVVRLTEVLKKLKECDRQAEFISVRCPVSLVGQIDFYETLKNLTENENSDIKSRICIEFPSSLVQAETSKAASAVADIKALGMKTAVRGCGKDDFPVTKLIKLMPDVVYTHPSVAEWIKEDGGKRLFSSFASFVTEMGIGVIAEADDEYKKAISGADCLGFLSTKSPSLSFEEIINRDEEGE